MRSILPGVLLLVLTTGLATAQTQGTENTSAGDTPSFASSLTIGYLNTDFSYRGTSASAYDFNGPLAALMLDWEKGSLVVSYGSSSSTNTWPALRTVGASLWLGGDAYIFRNLFGAPVAMYVPIRLNADYRYTSLDESGERTGVSEQPTLHLIGGGLGAGGGARFAVPFGPSFLKDNLVAQTSYVFAPGMLGNAGQGFDQGPPVRSLRRLKLRWATDLNFEIQLKNLLGDSVGIMVGYTLRTVSRSPEKPDSFSDALDTFIDRDDFIEVTDQHVFRVGFNW